MTMPPRPSLRSLIDTAHTLADASGKAILPYFRKQLDIENKAADGKPLDPVTQADRAAERIIRRHLANAHPDHGIVGEEYGVADGQSDFTWVIDPIDGTKAFITGTPLWGTLIGLKHGPDAVFGMMNAAKAQKPTRIMSAARAVRAQAETARVRKRKVAA